MKEADNDVICYWVMLPTQSSSVWNGQIPQPRESQVFIIRANKNRMHERWWTYNEFVPSVRKQDIKIGKSYKVKQINHNINSVLYNAPDIHADHHLICSYSGCQSAWVGKRLTMLGLKGDDIHIMMMEHRGKLAWNVKTEVIAIMVKTWSKWCQNVKPAF